MEIIGDELKKRFVENGEFAVDFDELLSSQLVFRKGADAFSCIFRELLHQSVLLHEDVLRSF